MIKLFWNFLWREKELKRQSAHLLFGISYALAFWMGWITPERSFLLLGVVLVFALFLRKRRRWLDEIVLMLEREKHLFYLPLRGPIFFILGVSLTITFFDSVPAFAGIVILSVTDSIGTLYGKYIGLWPIPWDKERHLEGVLAGWAIATLICFSILPFLPAFLGSGAGALADSVKWRLFGLELDDNLLIPLLSAAVVQVLL